MYIGYLKNQLAKMHNCSEDASALAFINGLRITHSLYKHLVKYVTCWRKILYRVQPYIQLETMKNFANPSFNCGEDGTKPKPQHEGPFIDFQGREHGSFKMQLLPHPQRGQPELTDI